MVSQFHVYLFILCFAVLETQTANFSVFIFGGFFWPTDSVVRFTNRGASETRKEKAVVEQIGLFLSTSSSWIYAWQLHFFLGIFYSPRINFTFAFSKITSPSQIFQMPVFQLQRDCVLASWSTSTNKAPTPVQRIEAPFAGLPILSF